MYQIQIDEEIYILHPTISNAPDRTVAQNDLYAILCTLASIEGPKTVRSEVLAELLGLKSKLPVESRIKHMMEKGYIERQKTLPEHLEQTYQAILTFIDQGIQPSIRQLMDTLGLTSPGIIQNRLERLKQRGLIGWNS